MPIVQAGLAHTRLLCHTAQMLRWLAIPVLVVGCSAASSETGTESDVVAASPSPSASSPSPPARVLKCYGLARPTGQLWNHYRISADGKLHDGVVQWAKMLPNGELEPYQRARLDVSVKPDGDRLRIESTDAANGFRHVISVSASEFAQNRSALLDGRLEETNDEATTQAPQFMCKVGLADFFFVGDEAAKFADAPITSGDPDVGTDCRSGQCYVSFPAFVDAVENGRVRYGFDLSSKWSEAFATSFPNGVRAANARDGKTFSLSCPAGKCRMEITAPDTFGDLYTGPSH